MPRNLILLLLYWVLCLLVVGTEFVYASMTQSFYGVEWGSSFALFLLYLLLIGIEVYTQIRPYKRKSKKNFYFHPKRVHKYQKLEMENMASKKDDATAFNSQDQEENEKLIKDETDELLKQHVYADFRANLLSRLTFQWFTAILQMGSKTPFQIEHLGKLPSIDTCQTNFDKMDAIWQQQKLKGKDSLTLWKTYFLTFSHNLYYTAFCKLSADFCNIVQPLLLSRLIQYVENVQAGKVQPINSDDISFNQFLR